MILQLQSPMMLQLHVPVLLQLQRGNCIAVAMLLLLQLSIFFEVFNDTTVAIVNVAEVAVISVPPVQVVNVTSVAVADVAQLHLSYLCCCSCSS